MPAKSARQQRFMGAELNRARSGKKTKTGMSEDKLAEFAGTKHRKTTPRHTKRVRSY